MQCADYKFQCNIWETIAHCDVYLLLSHCIVISIFSFLQCINKHYQDRCVFYTKCVKPELYTNQIGVIGVIGDTQILKVCL